VFIKLVNAAAYQAASSQEWQGAIEIMQTTARPRFRRAQVFAMLAASAVLLAGCGTPEPKAMVHKSRSKEYFSEKDYGVKASPYARASRLVGRDQLGKPYKIRGKWYHPKEDRHYSKVGTASWYGDAFHGRLTANGEVYNVADLTAAHPTMPLPSYARVTNLSNGSSVIVRVNDRGPYHDGRLIDLSQRAAQMLGYANVGTAKVKVDYVGRAPLEGNDEPYLMASYKPGNQAPDPSDGLPTGVMIAMNGSTPSVGSTAFPGKLTDSSPFALITPAAAQAATDTASASDIALPEFGPIVPQRPDEDVAQPARVPFAVASLSYADERVGRAANAFAALDNRLSSAAVVQSWKQQNPNGNPADDYVAAGTFDSQGEARQIARNLAEFGKVEIEQTALDGRDWYSVNLYPDGHGNLDALLQAAWSHGAPDALAVRD
jgi:rare lipoprotein A